MGGLCGGQAERWFGHLYSWIRSPGGKGLVRNSGNSGRATAILSSLTRDFAKNRRGLSIWPKAMAIRAALVVVGSGLLSFPADVFFYQRLADFRFESLGVKCEFRRCRRETPSAPSERA